jgi:hypothetical protein
MTNAFGAKQNVDAALEALRIGLSPFVTEQMKSVMERTGDSLLAAQRVVKTSVSSMCTAY